MTTPSRRSFADLEIGESVETERLISAELVDRFADVSGDRSPIHIDESAARAAGFEKRVAHGVLLTALCSEIVGMRLPGEKSLLVESQMTHQAPVFVGDLVTLRGEIQSLSAATRHVGMKFSAFVGTRKVAIGKFGILVK